MNSQETVEIHGMNDLHFCASGEKFSHKLNAGLIHGQQQHKQSRNEWVGE